MSGSSRPQLLCSIHDVGPAFETQVDRLADLLTGRLGGNRFAMLVVPDHWGASPVTRASAFAARLRAWSDSGVEMFVHGWYHRDDASHAGARALKAQFMTASEGEFLGLDAAEAARRMRNGKALIEDIIGREVAGFIAPAWLYGPGAMEALGESGFALAEDHMKVWRPDSGTVLATGPVVTWASRSPARTASSIAFAGLARTLLRPLKTVRIAVHPGDTSKPELICSIERTLAAFARNREAGRYADLLT